MDARLFEKILEEFFPVGSADEGVTLEYVPDTAGVEDDEVQACFRLIEWDTSGDKPTIAAIKEQVVELARVDHLEDLSRYRAFLESVSEVFAGLSKEDALAAMPVDLFNVDLLDTTDANTAEEFGRGKTPQIIEPWRHLGGQSPTFKHQIRSLAFRSSAPHVLVLDSHKGFGVWDVEAGEWRNITTDHPFGSEFLAEGPAGTLVGVTHRGVVSWCPETNETTLLTDDTYGHRQFEVKDAFVRGPHVITYEESGGWSREVLRVRVFDLASESLRTEFTIDTTQGGAMAPTAVTVTPDGQRVVGVGAADEAGWLDIWDIGSGERLEHLSVEKDATFLGNASVYHRGALLVSPDGKSLATVWGGVFVVSLADEITQRRYESGGQNFSAGCFLPDGRLATCSEGGVYVYDLASPEPSQRAKFDTPGLVIGCEASGEHGLLAVVVDQSLCLFELDELNSIKYGGGHGGSVEHIAMSTDGKRVASAGGGTLKLWGDDDNAPVWSKPMRVLGTLGFSPDGASILTNALSSPIRVAAEDGSPQFIGTERATVSRFGAESSFHLRYDEEMGDETVRSEIYLYEGEPLEEVARGQGPYFRCVPCMDHAAKIGVFFDEYIVYGWDLREMKELWRYEIEAVDVAISDDGEVVAVKSFSHLIILDAASGKWLGEIRHDELVYALAFSPGGNHLAIPVASVAGGCSDVAIYRLNRPTTHQLFLRQVAAVHTGHVGNVTAAAFSADAGVLATGGADGTVELHQLDWKS